MAEALLAGGLPCAEITFRTAAAAERSRRIADSRPEMLLGAGTVLTVDQAEQAVAAGARFVVSPGFSAAVVDWCISHSMPVLPGVATPTDIMAALEKGLQMVKFFPAEAYGGITTLKALSAPFGGVKFMPTGGVSAKNLADYLALPAVHAVRRQLDGRGKADCRRQVRRDHPPGGRSGRPGAAGAPVTVRACTPAGRSRDGPPDHDNLSSFSSTVMRGVAGPLKRRDACQHGGLRQQVNGQIRQRHPEAVRAKLDHPAQVVRRDDPLRHQLANLPKALGIPVRPLLDRRHRRTVPWRERRETPVQPPDFFQRRQPRVQVHHERNAVLGEHVGRKDRVGHEAGATARRPSPGWRVSGRGNDVERDPADR